MSDVLIFFFVCQICAITAVDKSSSTKKRMVLCMVWGWGGNDEPIIAVISHWDSVSEFNSWCSASATRSMGTGCLKTSKPTMQQSKVGFGCATKFFFWRLFTLKVWRMTIIRKWNFSSFCNPWRKLQFRLACCVRENSQLSITYVINMQEKRSVLSFVSLPGQETSAVLAFSLWP